MESLRVKFYCVCQADVDDDEEGFFTSVFSLQYIFIRVTTEAGHEYTQYTND